ncbi:hypothetical protein Mal48_00430 [Thalassoglobus polymorphus]|uniref:Uncharacterized protein n=1 Tax=Thalassoglobus polymorphus TaxID=2527994 RepID=A0A517QGQ8_9PLAN|nr:hypothetical protein Mal48_00430 [Thalassoglobus polymorphus]
MLVIVPQLIREINTGRIYRKAFALIRSRHLGNCAGRSVVRDGSGTRVLIIPEGMNYVLESKSNLGLYVLPRGEQSMKS